MPLRRVRTTIRRFRSAVTTGHRMRLTTTMSELDRSPLATRRPSTVQTERNLGRQVSLVAGVDTAAASAAAIFAITNFFQRTRTICCCRRHPGCIHLPDRGKSVDCGLWPHYPATPVLGKVRVPQFSSSSMRCRVSDPTIDSKPRTCHRRTGRSMSRILPDRHHLGR